MCQLLLLLLVVHYVLIQSILLKMASKESTFAKQLSDVQIAMLHLAVEQGSLECHTIQATMKGEAISPALQKVVDEAELRMNALLATEARLLFEVRLEYANWVYKIEQANQLLHTIRDTSRPVVPSRLMYLDDGNPIFLRDSEDRYSSYQFWMETLGEPNSLSVLGKGRWVSCVELGVSAELLDELYEIESRMVRTQSTTDVDLARDLEIRAQFRK